ncbi:MAG: class I SAM-dependent methyltransferase [Halapricum sp.]
MVFLAGRGYEMDAIDQSIEGLRITRSYAAERNVDDRINLIEADAPRFDYPEQRYDVVIISFFRTLARLCNIKAAP